MKLPKGMGERAGWSTVAGAVHLFISYTIIVLTQNGYMDEYNAPPSSF